MNVEFNEDESQSDNEEDGLNHKSSCKAEKAANMKRVLDLILKEKYDDILHYDELNREIAAMRVLNGFIALKPAFPPTFKRTRDMILSIPKVLSTATDTTIEGTSSSTTPPGTLTKMSNSKEEAVLAKEHVMCAYYHHKRIPSYTDRILYKSMPAFKHNIRPMFFQSVETAISSDHKPVRAGFQVSTCPVPSYSLHVLHVLYACGAVFA